MFVHLSALAGNAYAMFLHSRDRKGFPCNPEKLLKLQILQVITIDLSLCTLIACRICVIQRFESFYILLGQLQGEIITEKVRVCYNSRPCGWAAVFTYSQLVCPRVMRMCCGDSSSACFSIMRDQNSGNHSVVDNRNDINWISKFSRCGILRVCFSLHTCDRAYNHAASSASLIDDVTG